MSSATKKTKKPKLRRTAAERAADAFIPPTTEGLLSIEGVAKSMNVSPSTVKEMIRRDEYPKPDKKIGVLTRWTTILHNDWVRKQAAKG